MSVFCPSVCLVSVCLYAGQQSLSEEVRERTQSRLLRLEKENQRLLRTIEELRTSSITSSPLHSRYQDIDQDPDRDLDHLATEAFHPFTKPSEPLGGRTRLPKLYNGVTHEGPPGVLTAQHACQGDPECTTLEEGPSEALLLTETLDSEDQEKGQLDAWESSENIKDLVSDATDATESHGGPPSRCVDAPPGLRAGRCSDSVVVAALTGRSCYAIKHTERLEAKCRTLDTDNQRLQASLDNSGGFRLEMFPLRFSFYSDSWT